MSEFYLIGSCKIGGQDRNKRYEILFILKVDLLESFARHDGEGFFVKHFKKKLSKENEGIPLAHRC